MKKLFLLFVIVMAGICIYFGQGMIVSYQHQVAQDKASVDKILNELEATAAGGD